MFLDFANAFRIEDLVRGRRFVTARVTVGGRHDIWLNISKDGWPWVVAVDAPETTPGGGTGELDGWVAVDAPETTPGGSTGDS